MLLKLKRWLQVVLTSVVTGLALFLAAGPSQLFAEQANLRRRRKVKYRQMAA
jgi:hypothetical protein